MLAVVDREGDGGTFLEDYAPLRNLTTAIIRAIVDTLMLMDILMLIRMAWY